MDAAELGSGAAAAAASGGSARSSGGRSGRLRRSASAPELLAEASLESLTDQALALAGTPCSVLPADALADDPTAASLRQTLEAAQREILAAVQAGVLDRGTPDAGQAVSGEQQHPQHPQQGVSDADAMARLQQAAPAPGRGSADRAAAAAAGPMPADDELLDEAELAGLSAREREAAIKRAKNREAARRSRERKVERIAALRADTEALRNNNFVLLRCIEEVAGKGLAARAEQRMLRDKLARLMEQQHAGAALAPGHALMGAPAAAACIPPPAGLEEELQRMAVGGAPASPTHLLRHGFLGPAEHHHHLHPSPSAAGLAPQLAPQPLPEALQPQLQHQSVLTLKQHGQGLGRSCSAPGGLLTSAAAGVGMGLADAGSACAPDGAPPPQQPWFRGVAV